MMAELLYLVVENAPDVCEGIIRRMAPYTQWKTLGYALSVKDAIAKIATTRPQLLFIDWGLNGGSAFEVMQAVQNMPAYNPYIIFNTGFQKDNPEIPQELINHYRVDKYIVKPIWENLKSYLSQYLLEAEEKAGLANEVNKKTWLEDNSGKKLLVDLNKLICICQHPAQPRQRIFYFYNGQKEIIVPLQWHKCYELLNRFSINYFVTKNRGHLVCKEYIEVYEKPFVRLKGFPAKIEVVKENVKQFETWLNFIR
jgi:CheY-like chemotaxis protein